MCRKADSKSISQMAQGMRTRTVHNLKRSIGSLSLRRSITTRLKYRSTTSPGNVCSTARSLWWGRRP